jgi:hypothetical protein
MDTVLYIRRDKEYYLNNTLDNKWLRDYSYHEPMIPYMIGRWGEAFGMSYLYFRKKIAEIAFKSQMKNNFDDIFLWNDKERFEELKDNTLIFPVDEDDWYSPNLVEEVKKNIQGTDKNIIRWNYSEINAQGSCRSLTRWYEWGSCAYGAVTPLNYKSIRSHRSMELMQSFSRSKVSHLDKYLSVKVESIGGIYYFYKGTKFEEILSIARNRKLVQHHEALSEYKELVDEYNALLNELYDSLIG